MWSLCQRMWLVCMWPAFTTWPVCQRMRPVCMHMWPACMCMWPAFTTWPVSAHVTSVHVHVSSTCARDQCVRACDQRPWAKLFNQTSSLPVIYQSLFANQSFAERYLKGIPETFQDLTFALQLLCVSSISAMGREMEKQLKKKNFNKIKTTRTTTSTIKH